MKILHILYSGLGGHGNVFFSMADADKEKRYQFEALFNGIEDVKDEYRQRCKQSKIPWYFVKKKKGLDIGYYIKLYRAIKKSRPDIIFLHGGAASVPAKLAKMTSRNIRKLIVRETQANHLKTTIDWVYLLMSMLLADRMVYLSNAYKEEVKKKFPLFFKERKTAVIPNGIDLDVFTRAENQPDTGEILLGMQSRLTAIKDHLTLLDAFSILQNQAIHKPIRLLIAGDGEFKDRLVKHARSLGIAGQVSFTGMLEEKDLVPFLQKLDIYIHASLGETMSTAIMQAMACGKPIIASDVPGISNMITDKVTGLLVPPKHAMAMAEAIMTLLNDRELASKLAANALTFANENYSNTKMLDNYTALFTG